VVLLFSGQGSQYAGMGTQLRRRCPVFRRAIARCSGILGYDVLGPGTSSKSPELDSSRWSQVAVFATSFAYAQCLLHLGIEPMAVVGHSAGEYAAAVHAGVMELEDALRLLDARGRLMDEMMAPGGMLAVFASASQARAHILQARVAGEVTEEKGSVGVACDNAPDRVVVSGPRSALDALRRHVEARGTRAAMLKTAKAFHSPAITAEIEEKFRSVLKSVRLRPPKIPMLCNSTGGWLTPSKATDPDRWVKQMRRSVRFRENIETAMAWAGREKGMDVVAFVEVGPGKALASLAKRHFVSPLVQSQPQAQGRTPPRFLSLHLGRHPKDAASGGDFALLLEAVGGLWRANIAFSPARLFEPGLHDDFKGEEEKRGSPVRRRRPLPRRVSLPTYAFDRKRCWIGPSDLDTQGLVYQARWESVEEKQEKTGELEERPSRGDRHLVPLVMASKVPGEAAREQSATLQPDDREAVAKALKDFGRVAFVGAPLARQTGKGEGEGGGVDEEALAVQSAGRLLALMKTVSSVLDDDDFVVSGRQQQPEVLVLLSQSNVGYGAAWGLAKVAAVEFAGVLKVRRLLWPASCGMKEALAKLTNGRETPPPEITLDPKGNIMAPRLRRFRPTDLGERAGGRPSLLRTDGTWIITGGSRGIGLRFALWLCLERNIKSFVLVGRREWRERPSEVERMEAAGASVHFHAADVAAGPEAAKKLLAKARALGPPLRGLVHSAGILDDGILAKTTSDRLERVLKVKTAAWALHKHLKEARDDLDAVVLFSSTSSVLGTAGQGSYVAANQFLDWMSERLAKDNLFPTLAVQWGAWSEVGMSVDSKLKEVAGESHLKPAEALNAFGDVLDHSLAQFGQRRKVQGPLSTPSPSFQFAIMKISDWKTYATGLGLENGTGLVEHFTGMGNVATQQAQIAEQQGEKDVLSYFSSKFERMANLDVSLGDAGLDSLDVINLRNSLKSRFRVTLPLDRFFDRSTSIRVLATELESLRK